jgi:hypothetical protein
MNAFTVWLVKVDDYFNYFHLFTPKYTKYKICAKLSFLSLIYFIWFLNYGCIWAKRFFFDRITNTDLVYIGSLIIRTHIHDHGTIRLILLFTVLRLRMSDINNFFLLGCFFFEIILQHTLYFTFGYVFLKKREYLVSTFTVHSLQKLVGNYQVFVRIQRQRSMSK